MALAFNPLTGNFDLVNAATTPGGSNTQVQFNNSGAFGGDSNFVWDNVNKRLSLGAGASPNSRFEAQATITHSFPTPGKTYSTLTLTPSGTNGDAAGITFRANNGGSLATGAQAGIYCVSSNAYGTRLYFATTNAYGTGAISALEILENGFIYAGSGSPSLLAAFEINTGSFLVNGTTNVSSFKIATTHSNLIGTEYTTTYSASGTTAAELYAHPAAGSSLIFTNFADFYAGTITKGSGTTITNCYGLYIEGQNAGTNNYGVYVASNRSYFGEQLYLEGSVSETTNPGTTMTMGGYAGNYGWIQTWNTKPLKLNPAGNDVYFGSAGIFSTSSNALKLERDARFTWNSLAGLSGSSDLFLARDAAATLRLGDSASGTPVSQTIKVQDATGSNIAGASFTLAAGKATGSAAGGSVKLQSSTSGGSGTTLQSLATVMEVAADSKLGFYGVTPIARAVLATGAAHTVDDVITALQNLGLVKQS